MGTPGHPPCLPAAARAGTRPRRQRRLAPALALLLALGFAAGLSVGAPAGAQTMATLVATAQCGPSPRYDDQRFTLSAPATVGLEFDVDGNWWIQVWPAGPMVAQGLNGQVTMPPGITLAGGTLRTVGIPLAAGTYLLHGDCSGPQTSGSAGRGATTKLQYPAPPPTPAGPVYASIARAQVEPTTVDWLNGYNDRIFLLTARQIVGWGTAGPDSVGQSSNGYISNFNQRRLWSMTDGTVNPGSSLDLVPGAYCLHTDYRGPGSTPFSDQWTLEFVGPTQPAGAPTSVSASYNTDPTLSSPYADAFFTLGAAQVVTVNAGSSSLNGPTYGIFDSGGRRWYSVIDGKVQSCSAVATPAVGRAPGRPGGVVGVMLPPGTYGVRAERGSDVGGVQTRVSVGFVGTAASPFPVNGFGTCPCGGDSSGYNPTATRTCEIWDVRCQLDNLQAAINRHIEEEIDRYLEEMIRQSCASALIPTGSLVAMIALRRRSYPPDAGPGRASTDDGAA